MIRHAFRFLLVLTARICVVLLFLAHRADGHWLQASFQRTVPASDPHSSIQRSARFSAGRPGIETRQLFLVIDLDQAQWRNERIDPTTDGFFAGSSEPSAYSDVDSDGIPFWEAHPSNEWGITSIAKISHPRHMTLIRFGIVLPDWIVIATFTASMLLLLPWRRLRSKRSPAFEVVHTKVVT